MCSMSIKIDFSKIIYESVDNETLIIDSQTGFYYVLLESASEIWQLLCQGTDRPTLLHQVAQQYGLSIAELQPPVDRFLNQLQEAGLVTVQASQADAAVAWPVDSPSPSAQPGASFVTPELHSFTDMHELLLMDPIHEVAETGWPFAPVKS